MVKRILGAVVATLFCEIAAINAQESVDSIAGEELREIVVNGQSARQRVSDMRLGVENLELSKLSSLPMLFGENDLIKSISFLPGVHSEGGGIGGFEVRGGTASQNLVMLDGMTLYNPSHVMGVFSTFNDDAIGRATLYKGPIPAVYGGATSSVLETQLEPGNMSEYHASATIGLLAAKVKAEGPIAGDKLSFAVAARRSYVDMFLKMIPEYRSTVMNFYDVTAKVRFAPGPGDCVDASFFVGHDNLAVSELMGLSWGNIGGSLNWRKYVSDRLSLSTTAAFTNYAPDMWMSIMSTNQALDEFIRSYSVNEKVDISMADGQHNVEAGVRSELLQAKSAEWVVNDTREKEMRSGWQNALWVNYEGCFRERFSLSAGVRLSLFSAMSGGSFHQFETLGDVCPDFSARTYFDAEPRVSLKYGITELHSVKIGVGRTTQNVHSIRSSSTSFPFDRYALTSDVVRPERAMQYGVGYAGMSAAGDYDWSVEGYYKSISNVYDYQDGCNMMSDIYLEDIILGGRGRSYGAEFMLRKNTGRLTGWISYTLSHTESKIPGINSGQWYDATNDRRHDLSVIAIYDINGKWTLSGSWIFSSGQPITAPDVKYQINGTTCYYYSRRNAYLTPSSHRLDLSATYTRHGKRLTSQWSFGIYNVYCRYNPYIVYFEDDSSSPSGTRAVQQSLFGLLPSVSYTLKF